MLFLSLSVLCSVLENRFPDLWCFAYLLHQWTLVVIILWVPFARCCFCCCRFCRSQLWARSSFRPPLECVCLCRCYHLKMRMKMRRILSRRLADCCWRWMACCCCHPHKPLLLSSYIALSPSLSLLNRHHNLWHTVVAATVAAFLCDHVTLSLLFSVRTAQSNKFTG